MYNPRQLALQIVFSFAFCLVNNNAESSINSGFESGDITGWTANNSSYVQVGDTHSGSSGTSYSPVEGNYYSILSSGQGTGVYTTLSQTIQVSEGQNISGWAAFDFRDNTSFDDTAWVKLLNASGVELSTLWMEHGFSLSTNWDGPWAQWSWQASKSGTYTIAYGVANLGDNALSSIALFDKFSIYYSQLPSDSIGYWDIDGSNFGVGGSSPSGSWQGPNWSTNVNGTSYPRLWKDGCDATFSSGNDATGEFSVTLDDSVIVRDMSLKNGQLTIIATNPLNSITFTDPRDSISALAVDTDSTLSLDAPVYASGGLAQMGNGQLNFNRPLTVNESLTILSGTTYINDLAVVNRGVSIYGGSLLINGLLNSSVINHSILGGSGTINGSVNNNGIISPGNSTGTLTIGGSYTHGSGAVYLAELTKNGRSDLLNIHGKATINGGAVKTSLPRRLYSDGYSWDILRASGGVYGEFSNISGQPNSNTLYLSLNYGPTEVDLEVNRLSYSTFTENKGAQAIGRGLDDAVPVAINNADDMENLLIAMDFDYTVNEINNTLSALNPEIYPTFLAGQQHAALNFSKNINQRTSLFNKPEREDIEGESPEPRWMVWGQAQGLSVNVDKTGEYNEYDFTSAGVVVGIDKEIAPTIRLGVATAVDKTEFDYQYGANGNQNNLLIGTYLRAKHNRYFGEVEASIGFYNNDSERNIGFTDYASGEETDFNGQSYLVRIGGGYSINFDAFSISPVASISFLHLSTDDFQEKGDNSFSLNFEDSSENVILSYLGVQATSKLQLVDKKVTTRTELGWQHDFHGDEFEMDAWFDNYPSFVISGPGLDEDMLVVSAEALLALNEKLNAFVDLGGYFGTDTQAYNLSVGLQWAF